MSPEAQPLPLPKPLAAEKFRFLGASCRNCFSVPKCERAFVHGFLAEYMHACFSQNWGTVAMLHHILKVDHICLWYYPPSCCGLYMVISKLYPLILLDYILLILTTWHPLVVDSQRGCHGAFRFSSLQLPLQLLDLLVPQRWVAEEAETAELGGSMPRGGRHPPGVLDARRHQSCR